MSGCMYHGVSFVNKMSDFEENTPHFGYTKCCPVLYHPAPLNVQEISKFRVDRHTASISNLMYIYGNNPANGNSIFFAVENT